MEAHPWPAGRDFIIEAQVRDWDDLSDAIRNAINGYWSMEVEWHVGAIRKAANLVGATPWGEVPFEIVYSGLYRAILEHGSIEQPEYPTRLKLVNTAEGVMRDHYTPGMVLACERTANELKKAGLAL